MIEDDLKRAEQARHLLDNPLLQEVLNGLKQSYLNEWASSKPEEVEKRERLYMATQVVDGFEKELKIILENGAITKAILKKKQAREGL